MSLLRPNGHYIWWLEDKTINVYWAKCTRNNWNHLKFDSLVQIKISISIISWIIEYADAPRSKPKRPPTHHWKKRCKIREIIAFLMLVKATWIVDKYVKIALFVIHAKCCCRQGFGWENGLYARVITTPVISFLTIVRSILLICKKMIIDE